MVSKTYRVVSTISTSNAKVQIRKGRDIHNIEMNVSLTASVVKVKSSVFVLGQLFSNEITVGAQGRGQISVFEMYALFGDTLKELLRSGNDTRIDIIATVKSDDNEYNQRTVVLERVSFDSETLFNLDDLNAENIKTIPFTFSGLEFVSDFNKN